MLGTLLLALAGAVACQDENRGWWTGADVASGVTGRPTPVTIRVRNAGPRTLHLPGHPTPAAFTLSTAGAKPRALTVAEGLFCPVFCPATGPPLELDCRRPQPRFIPLPAGAVRELRWSGEEAPEVDRSCGEGPAKPCRVRRATRPGRYTVRVCAREPGTCAEVAFIHPPSGPVELSLR